MTACKWNGRGNPRLIPGRHDETCPEMDQNGDLTAEECPGCAPCPEPHCVVCVRVHSDGACAECITATRDNLRMIAELCGALPAEAVHRGAVSEAAMLWGPTADPEAWRNRAMSAMQGRINAAYLEDCRDEAHPLWVLGTWEQVWRDRLDQPTDLTATLPRLVDYLDRHMHVMAEEPEVPFDDFARDLRACKSHLDAVLHDQNQGDPANVGCFDCGAQIERRLTTEGFEDHWTCTRCRRRYTYAEYNFALRATLEAAREESA